MGADGSLLSPQRGGYQVVVPATDWQTRQGGCGSPRSVVNSPCRSSSAVPLASWSGRMPSSDTSAGDLRALGRLQQLATR